MRSLRAGATLFECLMLTLMALGALAIAALAAERWGWPGALLGLPLGFIGILGGLNIIAMVGVLIERDWLPRCHQGVCSGDWRTMFGDYDIVRFGDDFGYRCRCGIEYMKEGRRFMRRRPDGSLEPYMVWTWPRGYVPDDGA